MAMDFAKIIRSSTGQKEPKDPRKKSRYGRKPEKSRSEGSNKNASFDSDRSKKRQVEEANEAIKRMRERKKSK